MPNTTGEKSAAVHQMTERADPNGLISAMVFLEAGATGPVLMTAKKLVAAATTAIGASLSRQTVGRVRERSQAFAVQVEPRVLEELARSSDVKTILPSQIDDILPPPVNRRVVG